MTFMMYVISLLIVYFLVYMVLKNKFNIQIITKGFFYKHVNRMHLWLDNLMIIAIVVLEIIVSLYFKDIKLRGLFLLFAFIHLWNGNIEVKQKNISYLLSQPVFLC